LLIFQKNAQFFERSIFFSMILKIYLLLSILAVYLCLYKAVKAYLTAKVKVPYGYSKY